MSDDIFQRAKSISVYDVLKPFCPNLKPNRDNAPSYWGPCPVCGGVDRFSITIRKNSCHCRKECGISGDAVAAWSKLRSISNIDAARELLGESKPPEAWKPRVVDYVPVPPTEDWKGATWQAGARKIVRDSKIVHGMEFDGVFNCVAYLQQRGLFHEWLTDMYEVGFKQKVWNPAEKKEMLAIVMPWHYDNKITTVKYRFIGSDRLRFTSKAGGQPILFGSHILSESTKGVLCEGEFNAMSVKFAISDIHAWSIGAQGNDVGIAAAIERAKYFRIKQMLVWFDEYDFAKRAKKAFNDAGIECRAICSSHGDANDILVKYGPVWLATTVQGPFEKSASVCDRCSGLKVIPWKNGIYQLCPECSAFKDE